jgi:hypothetical protein
VCSPQHLKVTSRKAKSPIDGNPLIEDPEGFTDPKPYWADPEGNIRRTSGERHAILKMTNASSKAEWMYVLESLGIGGHGYLRRGVL